MAERLGLIARISSSQTNNQLPEENTVPPDLEDFSELAQTTGTLPGMYTIKLQSNTKGVIHPAQRLPVALKETTI